jgi:uncharacterized protein YndB with AHSA1/START domain
MAYETTFDVPAGRQEVTITRLFDATPHMRFAAHTNPALLPRWWGLRALETTVESLEPRPGGLWRFLQSALDGARHAFHGFFHLVEAPNRLVYTFEHEGTPGRVVLTDVRFDVAGSRARLVQKLVYLSVEDRDAMVAAGMQSGLEESMGRLDELFRTPAASA